MRTLDCDFLVVILLLSVAGCRSQPLDSPKPCSGQLSVTASSGTKPSISWAPACAVNRLEVFQVGVPAGAVGGGWTISSPTGYFTPPVSYGVAPSGAVADRPADALQVGKTYEVNVFLAGGEVIILASGVATFTP